MSDQLKPRLVRRPNNEINANLIATGPRTEEGKANSSMNALKHGLTSKKVILPGEDQAEFDKLHDTIVSEHQPVGTLECELVSEIAASLWRLHRARAYENHALDGNASDLFLGGFFSSGGKPSGFDRLLRYMGSIERQLNRTVNQLRQLQADRRRLEAQPPKPRTMTATASQPSTSPSAAEFVSSRGTDIPASVPSPILINRKNHPTRPAERSIIHRISVR